MTAAKPTLDALVQEAKGDHGPDVDWAKVEAKLFPRVEREARAQAALKAYAGPKRAWVGAAVVIAAAAAVPLFFPHAESAPLDGVASTMRTEVSVRNAGALSEKERATVVVHATSGATSRELAKGGSIREGDVLDTRQGRAVFKRVEPSGVTWALEDGAQAEVRGAGGTLILALAKGAVEAQVAPVEAGEAFAIDVEGTRVAVHGTHLRVERQGGHAIVDLREGVVSIGAPPKTGSTYGDLVTAPAHVEFDAADPHGTLKVSHEATRVRAPQALETATAAESLAAMHLPAPPLAPLVPSVVPPVRTTTPATVAPVAAAPAQQVPPPAQVSKPEPPLPAPARIDPDPERTIAEQIRACARKHVEHADGVVITVRSRLELRVGDSGMVTAAIFDPPLAPEVQSCAASAIYGTRFGQAGPVTIPIDVTR